MDVDADTIADDDNVFDADGDDKLLASIVLFLRLAFEAKFEHKHKQKIFWFADNRRDSLSFS
eukprot:CAMPEP_0202722972 /NCGR_PEP_ID=MMETSP1385-20130828/161929_1 /ASSEMBLY_ACC=CAM_ASM_000861 /TAXON_ID=933848 /ORGANISM="Elphidium margaritaceum" /LENGTH=61 /DNA_ID=CAMNT_0049387887 /DNA_START=12 /DNA_END=194 /DNA_ORIENTATION=+